MSRSGAENRENAATHQPSSTNGGKKMKTTVITLLHHGYFRIIIMIMMTHLTDVITMWALESFCTVKDRIRRNVKHVYACCLTFYCFVNHSWIHPEFFVHNKNTFIIVAKRLYFSHTFSSTESVIRHRSIGFF